MANEIRTICFDAQLKIEACRFEGILQKFPNHFHDHYVIGFIVNGRRLLRCNRQECMVCRGDIMLFNPHDAHRCEQADKNALDYRCIHIQPDVMRQTVYEITGQNYLPRFTPPVLFRSDLASSLRELHLMILQERITFEKEELFFFLIEQLIRDYSEPVPAQAPETGVPEIQAACSYLEAHYADAVSLDELSAAAGLSKYHFLRLFTKEKGITPCSYLEAIRIGNAKRLLEGGMPPVEAAFQTGFSDQSHFTNFFKRLTGLTPRQYMRIFVSDSIQSLT